MALINLTQGNIDTLLSSLDLQSIVDRVSDAQDIINNPENHTEHEILEAKSIVNSYSTVDKSSIESAISTSIQNQVDEINDKWGDVENFVNNTVKDISGDLASSTVTSATGLSQMSGVTFTVTTTTGAGTAVPVPPTAFSSGASSTVTGLNSQISSVKSQLTAQLNQKMGSAKEVSSKFTSLKDTLSKSGIDENTLSGIDDTIRTVTESLSSISDMINNIPTISI